MRIPLEKDPSMERIRGVRIGLTVSIALLLLEQCCCGAAASEADRKPEKATAAKETPKPDDDVKRSPEAVRAVEAKRAEIKKELSGLRKHPWAGEYYYGDGLGVNVSLTLAPQSGFIFQWRGCLGLYDQNYGQIAEKDGRIRLRCSFENRRQGCQGIAEEFLAVPWGDRRYLIPPDRIIAFCNAVNSGTEPRQGLRGFFLLRRDGAQKKVTGFPEVPAKFEKYLLRSPIVGRIASVGRERVEKPGTDGWKRRIIPVTLDRGEADGVLPGMEFHLPRVGIVLSSVQITRVDQRTSEGEFLQDAGFGKVMPAAGWTVTTRLVPEQPEKPKKSPPPSRPKRAPRR
jgi:hypothetical protein